MWLYPAANVLHVVALAGFAAAVAIMDLAILGAFRGCAAAGVVIPARRTAIGALTCLALTGFVLFTAEASHVALNPVFQLKAALITAGLVNAALVTQPLARALTDTAAGARLPRRVRSAAWVSLAIWPAVAACGRLIAYF